MLTANRIQRLLNQFHPWTAQFPHDLPQLNDVEVGRPARVWSHANGVVIELDLPGRDLQDIDVQAEKNVLTIQTPKRLYENDAALQFRMRERNDGMEQADFHLPFAVHPDLTEVVYQHGVLRITVSKPAEEQPRKLSVRPGSQN